MSDHAFYFARSANSLRAAIAIELSGIDVDKHPLDLTAQEHKADWFLKLNAVGAVPVLVKKEADKDFVLAQSGAIMEYLFVQYRPDLIPADPQDRAQCWASTLSALSDVALQNMLARYLASHEKAAKFVFDRMISTMRSELGALHKSSFICGNTATMADYAHFPVVFMREAHLRSKPEFAHVMDWLDRLKADPKITEAASYSGLQL